MPWLLGLAAVQVVGFEVVRRVFVGTERGQRLDLAALNGNTIGQRHIDELVNLVLGAVTVVSVLTATVAIGFIALIRRQVLLAVLAVVLIIGSNVTTQLLKASVPRPEFGVDLARAAAGNSLPSGHATVAASVAVALVLVLPVGWRGVAAVLGAGYATLAGVATLAAGWHRPSDAVAAVLIVGVWAALVGLALTLWDRPTPVPARGLDRWCRLTLGVVGAVLLGVALLALAATDRALAASGGVLGWQQLFVAYAGGAAGIAGTACLVTGAVLVTAGLVLPEKPPVRTGRARTPVPAGRR